MKKKKITIVQLKKDIAEFTRDLAYEKRMKESYIEQVNKLEEKIQMLESKIRILENDKRDEFIQRESETTWLRLLLEHITIPAEKLQMIEKLREEKRQDRASGRMY